MKAAELCMKVKNGLTWSYALLEKRKDLADVQNLLIATPQGVQIPLYTVAHVELSKARIRSSVKIRSAGLLLALMYRPGRTKHG